MMGRAKQDLIRADDIGWMPSYDDNYVCVSCIEDPALQEVVERNLEKNACSYCGKRSKKLIAAPLDIVTEHMAECIARIYTDPAEVLPYESREGGYQGTVYDTQELLEEIGFSVESEKLFEDICSSFVRDNWAEEDWLVLSPDQRKFYGWEAFKRAVKHKRRYTFWSMGDEDEQEGHPDYMPVGDMLKKIEETIRKINLLKTIKTDTPFWRVRIHKKSKTLDKDLDFSSPPAEKAIQPNRMSPAGIPMFYCAEDYETACLETIDPSNVQGKVATGACFKSLMELYVLDFTELPPIPSFFDAEKVDLRNDLIFMLEFVRDISLPIERDGREHIEYVPTQSFTEYIRWMAKSSDENTIDGICYKSSKNGKKCYVLFLDQDECIDEPKYTDKKQRLRFLPKSLKLKNINSFD